MSVAVLIINLRAYESLERSLRALAPQLEADDEIVVIDYESDDAKLRRAMADFPRAVSIACADNRGFAAGVNLAASMSRAPYLLLLNPDTEVLGPVPKVLKGWLSAHPDAGVVGPRVLNADGSLQPSARRFPGFSTLFGGRSTWLTRTFPENWLSRWNMPVRWVEDPVGVDWISGACLMTPRAVFEKLGGFDESFFLYWEDADYCRRAMLLGHRCTYVPTVSVRHSGGACAEHVLDLAIAEFHRSAFYFYQKHSLPPGAFFAPLVRAGLYVRGRMRIRQALRVRMAANPRPNLLVVREASVSQVSEAADLAGNT